MSQTYKIIAINNSSNDLDLAVFQQDPDLGVSDVFSLAWFSKYAYTGTTIDFSWEIAYNFVWEQTGELVPGVIFSASQSPDANLSTENQITLDYDPTNEAYFFEDQGQGAEEGNLYIQQTGEVPLKQASVGIGMSGYGTFVVQAQPNIQVTFSPHPTYYIVAGSFVQGEVLDTQQITDAAEIVFPSGTYTMYAVLNEDNTWTISTSDEVNALVRAHRQLRGSARATDLLTASV